MLLDKTEQTLNIAPTEKKEIHGGIKLIPISDFANLLREKLSFSGLQIIEDVWHSNTTGVIFHGSIQVSGKSMHKLGPELLDDNTSFWIGARTSINGKYAISFACGASTENHKFFSGKIGLSRSKQKESLDLSALLEEAVDLFIKESDCFVERVKLLTNTSITEIEGAGIIMLATQFGMTPRHATYVFDEWHKGFLEGKVDAMYLLSSFNASIAKLGVADRFEFISNLYPEFTHILNDGRLTVQQMAALS